LKKKVLWLDHIISCGWGLSAQALKELEGYTAVIRKGSPSVCHFPASSRLLSMDCVLEIASITYRILLIARLSNAG
jgi:hypothetical protein